MIYVPLKGKLIICSQGPYEGIYRMNADHLSNYPNPDIAAELDQNRTLKRSYDCHSLKEIGRAHV